MTLLDPDLAARAIERALQRGGDLGEVYAEDRSAFGVALDDGRIKSAAFDTTQGFGLRAIAGEAAGYAHASDLSEAAIRRAVIG